MTSSSGSGLGAAPTPHNAAALAALLAARGIPRLDDEAQLAALAGSGDALVLFIEDPVRVPESWDVAVVLPEVLAGLARSGRVLPAGFVPPELGRRLQARYGFRLWPTLVALRGGELVGAIEGMRDWADYEAQIPLLLDSPLAERRVALPLSAPERGCG
jgi:hydrogenase-1 operon protein HyaE